MVVGRPVREARELGYMLSYAAVRVRERSRRPAQFKKTGIYC